VIYIVREAFGKLPRIFRLFCFLQFLACFCDVISVWERLFVQNVCLFLCVGCQKHFRGLVWIDCNSENLVQVSYRLDSLQCANLKVLLCLNNQVVVVD
jgi:hypothetical protein